MFHTIQQELASKESTANEERVEAAAADAEKMAAQLERSKRRESEHVASLQAELEKTKELRLVGEGLAKELKDARAEAQAMQRRLKKQGRVRSSKEVGTERKLREELSDVDTKLASAVAKVCVCDLCVCGFVYEKRERESGVAAPGCAGFAAAFLTWVVRPAVIAFAVFVVARIIPFSRLLRLHQPLCPGLSFLSHAECSRW